MKRARLHWNAQNPGRARDIGAPPIYIYIHMNGLDIQELHAMHGQFPFDFIGFGAMDGQQFEYKGFGAKDGQLEFTGFRSRM
jgi:hypothetical protein